MYGTSYDQGSKSEITYNGELDKDGDSQKDL